MIGFYVIKCIKCGSWFVQENRKKHVTEINGRCKTCNSTFKLFLKRRKDAGGRTLFYGPYNCNDATKVCQDIKKQIATKGGELFVAELSEFESVVQ